MDGPRRLRMALTGKDEDEVYRFRCGFSWNIQDDGGEVVPVARLRFEKTHKSDSSVGKTLYTYSGNLREASMLGLCPAGKFPFSGDLRFTNTPARLRLEVI